MKTTIFPPANTIADKKHISAGIGSILSLILAVNYLLAFVLLLSTSMHHGHGGGMGAGPGNAINLYMPSFLILFLLLILFHLISLFQVRIPVRLIVVIGFGQVISGTLTLGLLLFSRQSLSLLQTVYPGTTLLIISLALSILTGMVMIIKQVRHGHFFEIKSDSRNISAFPLPMNRYKNVRLIGEGGVGAVWYAKRIGDGVPVVVKVPRRDDEKTGMSFMQEINIWKDLEHTHIARVFSANILPVPYIEIEYLPGSVAELDTPVPLEQALKIIRGLVSALMYAHARGVIHCDIKPTNILLTAEGIPKLTDWGLARSGSSRWSVEGFSPTYASPEQQKSHPECKFSTDIWQTGMVFAELLTGKADIPSGKEPVFLTEKGSLVLSILQKCMAISPTERYPSVQVLSDDLSHIIIRE